MHFSGLTNFGQLKTTTPATRTVATAMILVAMGCAPLSGCSSTKTAPTAESALTTTLAAVKHAVEQGHLEEAQVTLKRVDYKIVSVAESEQLLDSWLNLASAYQEMGKFAVAGPVLETALEIAKSQNNEKRQSEILQRLKILAQQEKAEASLLETELVSSDKERHAAGRALRESAQKMQVKYLHSTDYQKTAAALEPFLPEAKKLRQRGINEVQTVMHILEEVYVRFKKYDRCAAMYEEHLKSLPDNFEGLESGDFKSIDNARDRIEDLAGIVRMRIYQKRYAQAEDYAEKGYALCKEIYGPNSIQFALRCHELGNLKLNVGCPDEAIDAFKEEVDSCAKRKDRQGTVMALYSLSHAYYSAMRYREAKSTLKRVLSMMRQQQAPDLYAKTQSQLSVALLKLQEIGQADALHCQLLETLKTPSLHNELIQHLIEWQQTCLFVPEKLPEVFSTGKQIISESRQDGKEQSVLNRIRNSQYYCAKAQLHLSKIDNAIAELNLLQKSCPATEPYYRRLFYNDLGNCYRLKGDLKTAEMYFRKRVDGKLEANSIAAWKNAFGWCLLEQGKTHEAKTVFDSMQIPKCIRGTSIMLSISKNAAMVMILKELNEQQRAKELLVETIKTYDDFVQMYEGVDITGISWKLSQAAGKIDGSAEDEKRLAKIALEMCDRYLAKSPWRAKVFEYTQTISK